MNGINCNKEKAMKCLNCRSDILQKEPEMCPYCHSRNLATDEEFDKLFQTENANQVQAFQAEQEKQKEIELKEAKKLERAGRFRSAALMYEKLEMWDKAGECRRMAKTNYVVSTNVNIGKVGSISMECPHCGASQPIASKSNEVICSYCKKSYVIPKKVLDLL